jgi:hypothetical protein
VGGVSRQTNGFSSLPPEDGRIAPAAMMPASDPQRIGGRAIHPSA